MQFIRIRDNMPTSHKSQQADIVNLDPEFQPLMVIQITFLQIVLRYYTCLNYFGSVSAGFRLLHTIFIVKSASKESVSDQEFHTFLSDPITIPKNTDSTDIK